MDNCIAVLDIDKLKENIAAVAEKQGIKLNGMKPDTRTRKFEFTTDLAKMINGWLDGSTPTSAIKDKLDSSSNNVILDKVNKVFAKSSSFTNGEFKESINKILSAKIVASKDKDGNVVSSYEDIIAPHFIVALNELRAALQSEEDIILANNLSEDEINSVKGTTRLDRLYPVIGQRVLEASGYKLAKSYSYNIKGYSFLGHKVIEALKEAGLVEVNDLGAIVQTGQVDSKGEFLKARGPNGEVIKTKGSLTSPKITHGKTIKFKDDNISELANTPEFSSLTNLINPPVIKMPKTEDAPKFDRTLSPDVRDTLPTSALMDKLEGIYSAVQSAGFTLNNDVKDLLRGLKRKADTKGLTLNQVITQSIESNDALRDILGLDLNKKYTMDSEFDSVYGRETSKLAPLKDLIENIDSYTDVEIYSSLFIARNGRTHTYDSFLNYQGDKFMSRYVLQPAKPTTYSSNAKVEVEMSDGHTAVITEKELLIKDVAIQLGITEDEVTGKDKDSIFEDVYKEYALPTKDISNKLESVWLVAKQSGFSYKRFWDMYTALEAVKAIRESKSDSVETNFVTEKDSSASGAQIKLLLALDNENITKLKELMDINNEDVNSMYSFGAIALAELVNNSDSTTASALDKIKGNTVALILEHMYGENYKESLTKNTRELLKYAIMTHLYGQSRNNNKLQVGEALVDDMLGKGADLTTIKTLVDNLVENNPSIASDLSNQLKTINDITTEHKSFNLKIPSDMQYNLKTALTEVLASTIGAVLSKEVLEKEYDTAMFSTYDRQISSLFEIADTIATEHPEIGLDIFNVDSPLKFISDDKSINSSEAKLKLTKLKETIRELGGVIGNIIIKQEFSNSISAKVVPIHAMDSAILLRTVLDYYGKGDKVDIDTAIQLIHDAIRTSSVDALALSKLYEKNTIKIAYEYDPRQAFIDSILSSGVKLTASQEKVIEVATASIQAKKKLLESTFNITDGVVEYGIPFSFTTDYRKELEATKASRSQRESKRSKSKTTKEQDINVSEVKATDIRSMFKTPRDKYREAFTTLNNTDLDSADTLYYDFETVTDNDEPNGATAIPYELAIRSGDGSLVKTYIMTDVNLDNYVDIEGLRSKETVKKLLTTEAEGITRLSTDEVFKQVAEIIKGKTLVSYYGTNFDDKILSRFISESANNTKLDIYSITALTETFSNGKKLLTVAKDLNVLTEENKTNAHQAGEDVIILEKVAKKLKQAEVKQDNVKMSDNVTSDDVTNITDCVK